MEDDVSDKNRDKLYVRSDTGKKGYSTFDLQCAMNYSFECSIDNDDDMVDSDASDVKSVLEKSENSVSQTIDSEFTSLKELTPLVQKGPENRIRYRVSKRVSV